MTVVQVALCHVAIDCNVIVFKRMFSTVRELQLRVGEVDSHAYQSRYRGHPPLFPFEYRSGIGLWGLRVGADYAGWYSMDVAATLDTKTSILKR